MLWLLLSWPYLFSSGRRALLYQIPPLNSTTEADRPQVSANFYKLGRGEVAAKSEESLVEAAQTGHLGSFAALYERYYSPMVALAYSVLADAHLAEDAAQQTFVIAGRDLLNLKSKDKFGAWLAGICRNVARQMQRPKGKFTALSEPAPAEDKESKEHLFDAICRAVWHLQATDKEPIILRYYEDMSYEQIAKLLGISPQAVHGRLTRAKRKIANYLKRNGFTGEDYEKP